MLHYTNTRRGCQAGAAALMLIHLHLTCNKHAILAACGLRRQYLVVSRMPSCLQVDVGVHIPTRPGQNVVLVGSLPSLGSWSVDGALPLKWTEGHVWRASIELPANCSSFEYKVGHPWHAWHCHMFTAAVTAWHLSGDCMVSLDRHCGSTHSMLMW